MWAGLMLVDSHCPVDQKGQVIFQPDKEAPVTVQCIVFDLFRILVRGVVDRVKKLQKIFLPVSKYKDKQC